jgi:hypothetical protein
VKDPIVPALAAAFAVLGMIAAYYLVRGIRDGRIGLRIYHRNATTPLSDGRERGYAYRSHNPSLFWTEIGMQVLAVAASIVMIFILMMAPDAPIR